LKDAAGFHTTSKFNPIPHAFISKLPGVDSKNVYAILNRVDTLDQLCALSLNELSTVLENSNTASILYSGLHTKLVENSEQSGSGDPKNISNRLKSKPVSSTKWK